MRTETKLAVANAGEDVIGECHEPEVDFDLLEVIMIRCGEDPKEKGVFDYIDSVFMADFKRLHNYSNIEDNEDVRKDVISVGGFSSNLIERTERRFKQKIADLEQKKMEAEQQLADVERKQADAERKQAELERKLAEAERKLLEETQRKEEAQKEAESLRLKVNESDK